MKLFGSGRSAPPRVGCFGKLPTYGDFLSLNAGEDEPQVLTGWLQEGVGSMPTATDPPADQTLQFVWRTDGARRALVGVLWPSRDAAGRRFPFCLFADVPASSVAEHGPRAPFAAEPIWRQFHEIYGRLAATPSPRDQYALLSRTGLTPVPDPRDVERIGAERLQSAALRREDGPALGLQTHELARLSRSLAAPGAVADFGLRVRLHGVSDTAGEASTWLALLFHRLAVQDLVAPLFLRTTRTGGNALFLFHRPMQPSDVSYLLAPSDSYRLADALGYRAAPTDAKERTVVDAFEAAWARRSANCASLHEIGMADWPPPAAKAPRTGAVSAQERTTAAAVPRPAAVATPGAAGAQGQRTGPVTGPGARSGKGSVTGPATGPATGPTTGTAAAAPVLPATDAVTGQVSRPPAAAEDPNVTGPLTNVSAAPVTGPATGSVTGPETGPAGRPADGSAGSPATGPAALPAQSLARAENDADASARPAADVTPLPTVAETPAAAASTAKRAPGEHTRGDNTTGEPVAVPEADATSAVFGARAEPEPVTGEFPRVDAIDPPTHTTETLSVPGAITDELPKMPPEPELVAARLREISAGPMLAGRLLRMTGPDGTPQCLYVDDRGGAALLSGLGEADLEAVNRSVLAHEEAVRLLEHLSRLHRASEEDLRRAVSAACARTAPPRAAPPSS